MFTGQISSCIQKCYFSVNLSAVFQTKTIMMSSRKDFLPLHHNSSLIYSLKYNCGEQCIGRTNQRLHVRIKQHVPTKIRW